MHKRILLTIGLLITLTACDSLIRDERVGPPGTPGSAGSQGPRGLTGLPGAPGKSVFAETYYTRDASDLVQPSGLRTVRVDCDPDDIAISGGCQWGKHPYTVEAYSLGPTFNDTPDARPTGWQCTGAGAHPDVDIDPSGMIVQTTVVCVRW